MILYIIIALIVVVVIGPALFSDRSPIPETSGNVHKISKPAELDAVLKSTSYTVVDFYADWCPPCRTIAPIFSKLADEHATPSKLAFAKVNVDHVKDVAQRYGISAMPTFLFFKDGKPTPVAVSKNKRTASSVSGDDAVDKVLGADAALLKRAVQALAEEAQR
ncbi:hypothetical protein ACN47E_006034 [Coniothyrium glycines]